MLLRVLSVDKLTTGGFKKIIDIVKNSNCPNESLSNTFPDRYKSIKSDKKTTTVYFDSKKASEHCYEFTI